MHANHATLHVIMNPAAGGGRLSPDELAVRCAAAGLHAAILPTTEPGDAGRLARNAVAAGADCVAVYGGDGTVAAVADGLAGSVIPLAILPGGTANILAVNLGIPRRLDAALRLIANDDHDLRALDIGYMAERPFLVRASAGYEATAIVQSGRALKRSLGPFGYLVGAVRALNPRMRARFRLTLDGEAVEVAALNIFVANAPGLGRLGLVLGSEVQPDDGLLDVIAVDSTPGSLAGMAASALRLDLLSGSLRRWQARAIRIETAHASLHEQYVHADGEALGTTPVDVRVDPGAVRVIVPG